MSANVVPRPGDKPPMSDDALEMVAGYFKLLAEPVRLKLLQSLRLGEKTVQQLVDEIQCSQANVSKHLKLLHDGGVIARRKVGLNVFYAITDPLIDEICDAVCSRQQDLLEARARAFAPGARPVG